MTYRPHTTEPNGLVVEDANGNRLLAIPTAAVELLEAADVIQYTRDGIVQRFQIRGTGGHLVAVPAPPDPPPPATAQLVNCTECGAGTTDPNPALGCVWCGTPFPAVR
jgi:hypothetical protein